MKHPTLRFAAAVVVLALSACASTYRAPELRDLNEIEPGEGLVYLTLHSPNEGATRFFFKGDPGSFETPGFPKGVSSQLLRVPAGEYEMTVMYVGPVKLMAEDFVRFRVEVGAISYPGDLMMDGLTLRVVDMSALRLPQLRAMNDAFENWDVIVASTVDKNRRKIYDGYRRVPNTQGRIKQDDDNQ